ncbi:MAG: hypothetical protein RIR79_1033 [Pseudomonadota bacterium]|jgi:hypothetical protein
MINRRSTLTHLTHWVFFVLSTSLGTSALAANAGDEVGIGIKEALSKGSEFAVAELGKQGGFLNNDKVRIPLPESLKKAEGFARQLGFGKQADELIYSMNQAAELAVVEAKPILLNAVKKISFKDATEIITGKPDAATQYFKRTTSEDLSAKFLPIVKQSTSKVDMAQKYQNFVGGAAKLGLVNEKDVNLDSYITRKAMDGLFVMIAEQERSIRKDPIGTGSALLGRVFGGLGKQ